jgi:hypothetical protein
LLELGCNGGAQYYVTAEKLDGESLRDVLMHLAPERLELEEADDVVRAIGSALVYAHEQGLAHGDVRAENVLVTMDRRAVLTNFLARRIAKVSARPPRASDDLKGLARLAAELYTGSAAPQAQRAAAGSGIPAARLNAIRAALATPKPRVESVAAFLAMAGLAVPDSSSAPRTEVPPRSSKLWRVVLPVAAAAAAASVLAAYYGGVGAAQQLTERGLDAVRAAAARVRAAAEAPPASAPSSAPVEPSGGAEPAQALTPAPAAVRDPLPESPAEEPPRARPPEEPVAIQPAAAVLPPSPAVAAAAVEQREPAVVSLGLSRISAREDHSVIGIDIVRSGDTSDESAVGWWTTPDTARADDDYANLGRQTVTFPAGTTVERVLIPIVNDGVRESDEFFTVHLSRPRGGVAGAVTATRVTLHDDD